MADASEVEGGDIPAPEAPKRRVEIPESKDDATLSDRQVAKAKKLFHKHDKDGSGEIDKAELAGMFKELNLRLTLEMFDELVLSYWTVADSDVSGSIGFDEFLLLYRKVVLPNNLYGPKLLKAAGRGHVDEVKKFVARGCNPNAGDGMGWSAVHHAAEYGQVDVIKALQEVMDMDLDIDAPDNYGWTPLFNACSNGQLDAVKHLLASGASTSSKSSKGRTALHVAASTGHTDTVLVLTGAGADVNAVDDAGWTPLYCACMHSHHGCIRALIEANTDQSSKDACGYTFWKYCDEEITKFVEGIVGARTARAKTPRSGRG